MIKGWQDGIRGIVLVAGFLSTLLLFINLKRHFLSLGQSEWRQSNFPWKYLALGTSYFLSLILAITCIILRLGTEIGYPTIMAVPIFALAIWGLILNMEDQRYLK